MEIKVILDEGAILPTKAHKEDAGAFALCFALQFTEEPNTNAREDQLISGDRYTGEQYES